MAERTEHGWERHGQGDRPTREAFQDRQNPQEVYRDLTNGNMIYVGRNGRTHVFTPEGRHHTSYHTSRRNRQKRVQSGKWLQIVLI